MIKSIRLTNELRRQILDSLKEQYVQANKDESSKTMPELDTELKKELFEIAYKDYSKNIPKGLEGTPFCSYKDTFMVNVIDDKGAVVLAFQQHVVDEKHPLGLPTKMNHRVEHPTQRPTVVYPYVDNNVFIKTNNKKVEKYLDAVEKYKEWNKDYYKWVQNVEVVLNSVNTTKQLLELWPEIEDHIPTNILNPSKGINLPAVNFSELNKRLK